MVIPAVRCHAHRKNGERCGRYATRGAVVCQVHGAGARHVREAARQRLEEMVLPALAQLRRLIDNADGDSVRLAAVRDVLDRAGLKPADLVKQDTAVSITVSYADVGLIPPPPGHATARTNGHALGDGATGV